MELSGADTAGPSAGLAAIPAPDHPPTYKDRSTPLVIFGIIEIPQDATCSFEKRAAGIRWRHLPRGAQKKLDSEPGLEIRHQHRFPVAAIPDVANLALKLCRFLYFTGLEVNE